MEGVLHLSRNGEECRHTSVCEDKARHGRDGFIESWLIEPLEVGFPGSVFRCCCGLVLNTNPDSDGYDCVVLSAREKVK